MQSQGKGGSNAVEIKREHAIYSILFDDDGKQVLSGGAEGVLQRWQVDDGHEVGRGIYADGDIRAAALSPNRKWVVCAIDRASMMNRRNSRHGYGYGGNTGDGYYAGVWDTQTQEKVLTVKGHGQMISTVDISSDSTKFATGGSDRAAIIWDMTTGKQLATLRHESQGYQSGQALQVVAVRFSPAGDRIATAVATNPCTNDEWIRIWDTSNGKQLLGFSFSPNPSISTFLPWSDDGRQLLVALSSEVRRLDTSSGSSLGSWPIPCRNSASVFLSRNQRFIVSTDGYYVSFWDTSTYEQIGSRIRHSNQIHALALSSNGDCIATGESNGKITFRNICDILPRIYLTLNLPLIYITDHVFKAWSEGDLVRVEELLTEETIHTSDPFYHACVLASRALARARLGQSNMAIDDAKESIKIRRSVIGHIANAVARVGNGEHDLALRTFDLVFSRGLATENDILLLCRAIILFECGKHDDAVSRVDDLIDIVDDNSLYITVRAYMFLLLGGMSLREGNKEQAEELLTRARGVIPFPKSPYLVVISLIFGWDFDRFASAIQLDLQECIKPHEGNGDAAMQSNNPEEAIAHYTTALSLDPLDPAGLLLKRSTARAIFGVWEAALQDADEAIKEDPASPWGYERRHAALHALHRYDEAVDAYTRMSSLIDESFDQDIRQRGRKYISPSRMEIAIESVVRGVFKMCPIVLIDVESGRLCDGPERLNIFKSEPQFKELVSSMTEGLDDGRIQRVVAKYFRYVMFSHVWEGKEPSFQHVTMATSVWDLDSSPVNEKLKKFCEVVRNDKYRWAWCDTCCIDKTNSTVLYQSLTMMYKWYEASTATLVRLADVTSPSALGDLTKSIWITRAWTAEEVLAPKVVRFYDRDWNPYLGDTRPNHKESPEIIQELSDAMGITREVVTAFNPDDLSVREKLRVASTRSALVEEDIAYSLIGIFKSDIRPHYGEGDAALGHLLEEIVARLNAVTVLAWTGTSSSYNSCLPATIAVYGQTPCVLPAIDEADMDARVAVLRDFVSRSDAMLVYERITNLPPARFANRRLHLPSIIFPVKKLNPQDPGSGRYRARVSGVGHVEFQATDGLSSTEPRKLILVHPWLCELRDPPEELAWTNTADSDEYGSDLDTEFKSAPSSPVMRTSVILAPALDECTRALRLVARLQQPFYALLLEQQRHGEFRRVATEYEIIVPGVERTINFPVDIRTEVVEIA